MTRPPFELRRQARIESRRHGATASREAQAKNSMRALRILKDREKRENTAIMEEDAQGKMLTDQITLGFWNMDGISQLNLDIVRDFYPNTEIFGFAEATRAQNVAPE